MGGGSTLTISLTVNYPFFYDFPHVVAFVVGVFSGSVDNCRGGLQESCVGFCGRGGLKITSPPSRLTDPLTLSLDNLSRPDTVNKEEL